MNKILDILAGAAKAVVAAATPIIVAAIAEVATELSGLAIGVVAAGATALTVYLTPNKSAE